MAGRTLFTRLAGEDDKRARALGAVERAQRAVSLYEYVLEEQGGDVFGRTEFLTHAEGGGELWPSLHAWPEVVSDALLRTARQWLARHPETRLVATSCTVDMAARPAVCVFILHHVSAAPVVADVTPAAPPATDGVGRTIEPPALAPQCRVSGCGE